MYPDGAHNAEGFFVDGDGGAFVVTKEHVTTIYRLPSLTTNGQPRLEQVARLTISNSGGSDKNGELATGAALSPDGSWVAIRSHHAVLFFESKALLAGRTDAPMRTDITGAREPQGEGITFGSDGTVYLVGEGGGHGRSGTLTRMKCSLAR
jgi:hypothetical protein